jgi:membrane protease YdiL (CAAX protease family)
MPTEPDRLAHTQAAEWGSALALLPLAATVGYYFLPVSLQARTLVQFIPQLLAYVALLLWASRNQAVWSRLGLNRANLRNGLRWGITTGLLLGSLNTFIILLIYPALGYDITFLKSTPHGRLPILVMVPWAICFIALVVELNFRGFLLGRFAVMEASLSKSGISQSFPPLALGASALLFAFDPFLVNTFRHLHWIALWDGLIWGAIRLHTGNLSIPVVAHAVEVTMMYLAVQAAIG